VCVWGGGHRICKLIPSYTHACCVSEIIPWISVRFVGSPHQKLSGKCDFNLCQSNKNSALHEAQI
jgi:hypothetical protein